MNYKTHITLTLTEEQARVVVDALEVFATGCIGVDEMTSVGIEACNISESIIMHFIGNDEIEDEAAKGALN